jgi:hypothetical protein
MGDSPVFNTIKNVAGYGVGTLAAIDTIKGGGLGSYLLNRQRLLSDPSYRATLIDSPFMSGVMGVSSGPAPAAPTGTATGGVAQPSDMVGPPAPSAAIAAPQDVRYLPTGGHWYPAVSPLDYTAQAKAETDRANMIGLTSADPGIRAQSKLAIGVPLAGEEITGPSGIVATGRKIVGAAGPGSQVQYKLPGGAITVGSPYIAGNYMDANAAAVVAARTGGVVVPGSVPGTYDVKTPEKPTEGEYLSKETADAARTKPNQESVLTGRTVNGVPSWYLKDKPPAGVPPLEQRGTQPAPPPRAAPPPPPPPPPAAPPAASAEQPAPAPPAAAPAPPPAPPPPPPPHEVVRQNPDGSFSPVTPPAPPPRAPAPRPPAPRAEATPAVAPPLLAAAAPPSSPLFQFPWQTPGGAPVATPAPVMVARAEPPPYEVVPGAELGGVASGAPPAPAEQRGPTPPPTPPAPASVVPFEPPAPGQPAPGTGATPAGMPAGTQEFTETRPLPADVGGSVTTSGKTPAALDYERRQMEIQKDVERKFGKIPEAKDVQGALMIRSPIDALLTAYPKPEDRGAYLGYVTPSMYQLFAANDPQYQHFLGLNDEIRSAMIAAGAPKDALDALPTGTEKTSAEYEAKLRSAADTADRMIAGQTALANMHTSDLSAPDKIQKLLQYMSGPSAVHYGPYPWTDEQAQSTATSAPPTSTTSPFLVDRVYPVQPSAQ